MEQELKQRLIGAAVITALAAIFVPMLFDDPVDETEKKISALKLPEVPVKIQEVEIAPLPEKVEDVLAEAPAQTTLKAEPEPVMPPAEAEEKPLNAPKPRQHAPSARESEPNARQLKVIEPVAEAEEDVPESREAPSAGKPSRLHAQAAPQAINASPAKVQKPVVRMPEPAAAGNAPKPAEPAPATGETGTRLYLNVGSFSHKNNAFALEEKLKQQGFPATVKEIASDKGPVFKVRVGPMADKAKVQATKNRLTQININSFVTPDE